MYFIILIMFNDIHYSADIFEWITASKINYLWVNELP